MNGTDENRPVNTNIQKTEEYPVAFPLNYPQ